MQRIILLLLSISTLGHAQIINELCPSNVSVYEDENEGFADWVEIFNNTPDDFDLEDFYLTDDLSAPFKWNFPEVEIESGSYAIFPAAELPSSPETISFSFGRKGGTIYMINESGGVVDSITYPSLEPNHSYGRYSSNWYYFDHPTPENDNETETAYKGYASPVIINRASGIYGTGTNITIRPEIEGQVVYYSLNGTNPVEANLYTEPLILETALSIRAVATGDSLIQSPGVYRTYFVENLHALPIVHLNIDSLELLDDTVGIYVLGPDADPDYPFWGANFWKDIEIHAYYEYFDSDLVLRESLDCGIKIHGGTVSTTRPMKSLRLVGHDRYEKNEFTYPYFSNKSIHHFRRLLLRNSGSDFNVTHMKDGVLHQFILDHDIDVDAQAYQPVIVYINGHFWGIHNMREKLDKYFVESNYGDDPEEVNMLEEEELIVIAGDSADFVELRDFVLSNDLTVDANYDWVSEHLDLNSMVDYFIMELFMNNRDWPYNNLKLWNSASHSQWRYIYSDLDAGIKYYAPDSLGLRSLEYILGPYGDGNVHVDIFEKLLMNPEFKRYFINRYADLLNTVLQADYIIPYIYQAKARIQPEMRNHFHKWYGVLDEWENNFEAYDSFFETRVGLIEEELTAVFDVGVATNVLVGMYPSDAGIIQLNTIRLDSFPFVGNYYPTNTINLTAIPETPTDIFLYWENLRTGEQFTSESIVIDPTEGDSLIAVFQADEDLFNLDFYPNPVSEVGQFSYSLPESGSVEINLVSIDGRIVEKIAFEYQAKGSYTEAIDFSFVNSGTYLISISTDYGRDALRLVKL